MERTPLFFLDEELTDLRNIEVEVSEEFYEAYLQVENNYKVMQNALFELYAEAELTKQEDTTEDEFEDYILEPVHDPKTLH